VVGCFIGPADLALSMGVPLGETGPGTDHEAAVLEVLQAAKKAGKAAGKHCNSAEEASMRIQQGFQFLAVSSDAAMLTSAARATFDAIDFSGSASGTSKSGGGIY
jgi:4-hydroxy-2-oxoheptanedioate aldolase